MGIQGPAVVKEKGKPRRMDNEGRGALSGNRVKLVAGRNTLQILSDYPPASFDRISFVYFWQNVLKE